MSAKYVLTAEICGRTVSDPMRLFCGERATTIRTRRQGGNTFALCDKHSQEFDKTNGRLASPTEDHR